MLTGCAGWLVGVMQAPGAWTYAGGGVLLAATLLVTVAAHQRQQREQALQQLSKEADPSEHEALVDREGV